MTSVYGAAANQNDIENQVRESSFVLAKTESYAVHLFKGDFDRSGPTRGGNAWKAGHYIAHIDRQTDRLTWLLVSGIAAKRHARIAYVFKRIAGLLVVDETLWVALYTSTPFSTDAYDMRPDARTVRRYLSGELGNGGFSVEAYDLKTASFLGQYQFPDEAGAEGFSPHFFDDQTQEILIDDSLVEGPLKATSDGIEIFGERFAIQNGEVVKT